MTFEFVVDGEPMAKERARVTSDTAFTPRKTVNYEAYIKQCYKLQGGKYYDNKFLKIAIFAYFSIPDSYTKKKKRLIEAGKLFPKKKDWDNIGKIVCDGLQGIAFKNDSYICTAHVYKEYTQYEPQVKIILDWIEEDD